MSIQQRDLDDLFQYPALPRRRPVTVGVKLLAGVLAGDLHCQWGAWVQTQYRDYHITPALQPAAGNAIELWVFDHTYLLAQEAAALRGQGCTVYGEKQNRFQLTLSNGVVLSGVPDLVAVDAAGVDSF